MEELYKGTITDSNKQCITNPISSFANSIANLVRDITIMKKDGTTESYNVDKIVSAINKSEVTAFSSIVGMIESKSFVSDTNNLPKPPRK